jgi:serine/threonine-protein kinase
MSTVSADDNLLLALLVHRLGLVDPDALALALTACDVEPPATLGAVLVAHGLLDGGTCAALATVAQSYLERHCGAPDRGVAALDPSGAQRSQLGPRPSGDTLVPPSSAPDESAETCVRPTLNAGAATRGSGSLPAATTPRYRRLRPHAHGGLGEVYLALDEELHREVAVKEIRLAYADDPHSRASFLLEGEVTGRLEHPGIVPVYGLGTHPDGRPYYAMRFIKGESLRDAIHRFHASATPLAGPRLLELRGLLGRLVGVCNAVAYAHSRGVLHRDLKPGNVMLGPFGETLVVDWGLARVQSEAEPAPRSEHRLVLSSAQGSHVTLGQTVVGTAAYMSPEQAEGNQEKLGPASDVYSLGATLYELLTGRPPFVAGDLDTEFTAVKRGAFPPPRQVRPSVPPALEAVCLKAMYLDPGQRYASATALADDIERWLADEPVRAYREPLLVRLGRWERRHRSLVASATVLLLTAVVSLAVSSVLIGLEQARTRRAHERADANFRTAQKAVDEMLTEVAEEQLAYEPRMEQKRRNLLTRARRYYQTFLEQGANDQHLRAETARAHRRLGDIARQLDDLGQARGEYEQAIALLDDLTARSPRPDLLLELADAHNFLGEVHRLGHDRADAVADYQRSLAVLDRLKSDDQPGARERRARCQYNLGIVLKERHEFQKAVDTFDQAIALFAKLATDPRRQPQVHQHLARAYLNRGTALRPLGRLGDAEKDYDRAIVLLQDLLCEHEHVPDYRHELGVACLNLGNVYRRQGRLSDASRTHRRAQELFEQLVRNHPAVGAYQADLATACNSRGTTLYVASEFLVPSSALLPRGPSATGAWALAQCARSEAGREWKKARDLLDRLVQKQDLPRYRGLRGVVNGNLGEWHLFEGRAEEALWALVLAISDLSWAIDRKAEDRDYRSRRDYFRVLLDRVQRGEAGISPARQRPWRK